MARKLWIGIPLRVEICRDDGVWPGELFGGGSFNGVCSIVRQLAQGDYHFVRILDNDH